MPPLLRLCPSAAWRSLFKAVAAWLLLLLLAAASPCHLLLESAALLSSLSLSAVQICGPLPFLRPWICWCRSILEHEGRLRLLCWSVASAPVLSSSIRLIFEPVLPWTFAEASVLADSVLGATTSFEPIVAALA